MDIKAWMREALATGAFATVDHVTPATLARATTVALRLNREDARRCKQWAADVLAEPRPLRRPPGPYCRICGGPLYPPRAPDAAPPAPATDAWRNNPEAVAAFRRVSAAVWRFFVATERGYIDAGVCLACGG